MTRAWRYRNPPQLKSLVSGLVSSTRLRIFGAKTVILLPPLEDYSNKTSSLARTTSWTYSPGLRISTLDYLPAARERMIQARDDAIPIQKVAEKTALSASGFRMDAFLSDWCRESPATNDYLRAFLLQFSTGVDSIVARGIVYPATSWYIAHCLCWSNRLILAKNKVRTPVMIMAGERTKKAKQNWKMKIMICRWLRCILKIGIRKGQIQFQSEQAGKSKRKLHSQ